jgi:beta-N-acetylhexosaminidase
MFVACFDSAITMPKANVGQHLFIGIHGQELDASTRRLLMEIQPGGVVLFARNIGTADQLRTLTRELHASIPVPPVIAIDQECQKVNRLRGIVGELPAIAEIKRSGKVVQAVEFGKSVGRCLREHGIDLDFAPVLDLELLDGQVDNALQQRCWGRTPGEVVAWAGAFIDSLQSRGVGACAKHFPGLGASHQDSHEFLPTITRSREKLLAEDVLPFLQLKNRLSAVMVSHGHYTAFDGPDPKPATLSKTVVHDVLRRQVGFDGVIVTDDMEMGAITRFGTISDAVVGAIQAGSDMSLICHTAEKIQAAHEALIHAAESKRLDAGQLAQSAARLDQWRARWK